MNKDHQLESQNTHSNVRLYLECLLDMIFRDFKTVKCKQYSQLRVRLLQEFVCIVDSKRPHLDMQLKKQLPRPQVEVNNTEI